MKFFLIQNAHLGPLQAPERHGSVYNNRIVSFLVGLTPSGILPVRQDNPDPEQDLFCTILRQQLQNEADSARLLHCELTSVGGDNVCFRVVSGPATKALVEILGENARIQVTIFDLRIHSFPGGFLGSLETSEMKIQNGPYACEDTDINQYGNERLEVYLRSHVPNLDIGGLLTITVSCDTLGGPVVTDKWQVIRKMLEEELGSDVTIIAGNGKEVKAHTGLLSAHSQVFMAMFQNDMKEAKTHTVEMPDLSEEGVRALLAYLYCWDDSVPNGKPLVAFEMLYAGHKYDIPVLEADMKKLLLTKQAEWYEVDVAMKLYLLAKKLPEDGERLKMKAIRVLKKNCANLNESPTYVALFQEDIEAAMELCKSLAA